MYEIIDADTDVVPLREDRTMYPHVLLAEDVTVHADSVAELLAGVIPGYLEFGPEGRLAARETFARTAAGPAQQFLVDLAVENEVLNLGELSRAERDALSPERFDFGDPVGVDEWTDPVFLIVVASDYVPYTEVWAPTGNVIVFDPATEESLLTSLHVGLVWEWHQSDQRLAFMPVDGGLER